MVNKQYNVHNPKLHKSKQAGQATVAGNSSPSPLRTCYPIVSTRPAGANMDEDGCSVESDSNNLSDRQSSSSPPSSSPSSVGGGYGVVHPRQLPPPPPPPTHRHRGTQSGTPQTHQPANRQNNLNVSRRSVSAELVRGHHGREEEEEEEADGDGLYGRNIQFYSEGRGGTEGGAGEVVGESGHGGRFGHGHGGKELTISDIGRFQYILQMDREVLLYLTNEMEVGFLFSTEVGWQ
uniref:Uncharacterized protein n=1 Tax=Anopheles farauti TaxID=69004 RepID=A0A182QBA7_9DIPT